MGKTLKPRVRCIINIQNAGAGLPDGGLYAAEQFQKHAKGELRDGQLPARGCIEVKSTGENIDDIARSEQVMRYVNRYKQVLVTNYRDFVLVGVNHEGKSQTAKVLAWRRTRRISGRRPHTHEPLTNGKAKGLSNISNA